MRTSILSLMLVAGLAAATPAAAQPGPDGSGGGACQAGMGCAGGKGGPGTMFLEWFDTDEDGVVTREEFFAASEERFTEADTNHDGKLSKEEFRDAPRPGRAARVDRMFDRLDTNKDGTLSKEEMSQMNARRFTRMDADGDGKITAAEIAQMAPKGPRGPKPGPDSGGDGGSQQ